VVAEFTAVASGTPPALFNDSTYCPPASETAPLTVTLNASGSSTGPSIVYEWDYRDGTTDFFTSPAPFPKTFTTQGSYPIQLVVRSTILGCTDSMEIRIDFGLPQPIIIVLPEDNQGCLPHEVCANISGYADYMFIDWDDGTTSPTFSFPGEETSVCHTYTTAPATSIGYFPQLFAYNRCGVNANGDELISIYQLEAVLNGPTFGCAPYLLSAGSGLSTAGSITSPLFIVTWDFGDGSPPIVVNGSLVPPSHTYTSPGNYTVTMTIDDLNCGIESDAINITIDTIPILDVEFLADLPGCSPMDISIDIDSSMNSSATNYYIIVDGVVLDPTIFPFDTTFVLPAAATTPEVHLITVAAANQCDSVWEDFPITVLPNLIDAICTPPAIACEGDPTVFQACNSYSELVYSWNFGTGAMPATATGPGPHSVTFNIGGTYNVVLTTFGVCDTQTSTVSIFVENIPTINLDAFSDTTGCSPLAISIDVNTALNSPLTDYIVTVNGVLATGATFPFSQTFTAPGLGSTPVINTIVVTAQNECGTYTETYTVTVLPNLTDEICSPSVTACEGSLFSVVACASYPSLSYIWDFGPGAMPSTAAGPGPHNISYSSAGLATVVLTTDGACSDNVSSLSNVIESPAILELTTFADTTVCSPYSAMLDLNTSLNSPGTSYQVTVNGTVYPLPITGFPFPIPLTITPGLTVPEVFTIEISANNSCGTESTAYFVTLLPSLASDICVPATTYCIGEPITIDACSEYSSISYTWTFPGGVPLTAIGSGAHTLSYGSAGTYFVALTTAGTCLTRTDFTTLVIEELPTASFFPLAPFCESGIVDFLNSSIGTSNFAWNFGSCSTPTISLDENPSGVVFDCTGPQLVTLTAGTGYCADTLTQIVDVSANPIALIGIDDTSACGSLDIAFFPATVLPGLQYSWELAGSVYSGPSHSATLGVGTWPLLLTVLDNVTGCQSSDSVLVTVQPLPSVAFTVSDVQSCVDQVILATLTSPGLPVNWDFGDGVIGSGSPASHSYAIPGNYTITAYQVLAGCSDSSSVDINVTAYPQVSITALDTTGCDDIAISLEPDSNSTAWLYSWILPDATILLGPTHVINVVEPGNNLITLNVMEPLSGCGITDTLNVFIGTTPNPAFTPDDSNACQGTPVVFTPTSLSAGAGYFWEFGDGTTSTVAPATHLYAAPGIYYVTLTAGLGTCADSASAVVQITPYPVANILPLDTAGCDAVNITVEPDSTSITWSYIWTLPDASTLSGPLHAITVNIPGNNIIFLNVVEPISGCGVTDSINVFIGTTPNPAFTPDDSNACQGTPIVFTPTSLSTGATYFWQFGDGTTSTIAPVSHLYAAPGSYTVELNAGLGACIDSAAAIVQITPYPLASILPPDTAGCDALTITVEPDSTTAIWNYIWTLPDASTLTGPVHTLTVLEPGDNLFTLSVSEPLSGCSVSDSLNVFIGTTPNPAFNPDDSNACQGTPIVFTLLTPTLGVTYIWQFGDGSTSTLSPTSHMYAAPGTYTIKLNASLGACADSATSIVLVTPYPVSSILPQDTAGCDVIDLVLEPDSTSSLWQYTWTLPDATTLIGPTQLVSVTEPGNNLFTLAVTEPLSGCSVLDSLQVFIGTTPDPAFTFLPNPSCTNETTEFTIVVVPGASYVWDFGDGGTSSTPLASHLFDTAGTYLVTLNTSLGDCIDSAEQYISVYGPPLATILAEDSSSCGPRPFFFSAETPSSSLQYLWRLNGTPVAFTDTATLLVTLIGTNTVILEVSDPLTGCIGRDTIKPEIYPVPEAEFVTLPDTFACAGSSLSFFPASVSVGFYSWYLDDSFSVAAPSVLLDFPLPGLYTITAIRSSSACSDTAKQTVLIHANPIAGFEFDTACSGQAITLADTSIAGEADDFLVNWLWQNPPLPPSSGPNPSLIFPDAGIYPVTLQVTNNDGCFDTITHSLVVNPTPIADFSWAPKAPCEFETVTLIDISPGQVDYRSWSVYGLPYVPGDSILFFPIYGAGLAIAQYVEGLNGCFDTATYNFPVREKPQPDFGYELVCEYATTTFEYTGVTPNDSIETIFWDFGDGNASGDFEPTYDFQEPGSYEVSLTLVGVNGCDSTVTQMVTVLERPTALIDAVDTICLGQTILFDASGSTNAELFSWDLDNGEPPFSTVEPTISYTFTELGNYDIYLNVSGYGCMVDTTHEVQVVQGDIRAFFELPDTLPLNIYDTILNQSSASEPFVEWFWTINGDTVWDYDHIFLYRDEGVREFCLFMRSAAGCLDIYCDESIVLSSADVFVTIPNGFTPNNDGRNDFFRPIVHTIIVEFLDFQVFNKWGELLYSDSDPFPGWDGTYRGKKQDTGGYYYIARYKLRGETIQKQGVVHLLR